MANQLSWVGKEKSSEWWPRDSGLRTLVPMIKSRKCRRWLLFGFTLLTVLLVFVGAFLIGPQLEKKPLFFTCFWAACFFCAILVLFIAVIDMRLVRKEIREKQIQLDAELAEIVSDAEKAAERGDNKDV